MNEYHLLLEHRIQQFTKLLRGMAERQRAITSGNSFMIFDEWSPGGTSIPTTPVSQVVPGLQSVNDFFAPPRRNLDQLEDDAICDLAHEGWLNDDSDNRFIQFSFNPRYFDIDIPNTTLYRHEACEILRYRTGFFYVTDRPKFEHPAEDASSFNPLRKVYVHGDEETAAVDMAFVWFSVWKFPPDWTFYVSAHAFQEDTNWENGLPLPANAP